MNKQANLKLRKLLGIRQACEVLSVSTPTIRALVKAGRLASFRTSVHGKYLFCADELARFIRKNATQSGMRAREGR